MKRQNLIFTAITASVSVSAAIIAASVASMIFSPTAAAQLPEPLAVTRIAAKPTAKALATGAFVGAEHPTAGGVTIIREGGKRYVEFDRQFKSDDGPDLFVLLHTQANPRSYKRQNYVRLGRLQNTRGKQRYEIPADVDLSDFQSVVIWCRRFNATFGFAALQ